MPKLPEQLLRQRRHRVVQILGRPHRVSRHSHRRAPCSAKQASFAAIGVAHRLANAHGAEAFRPLARGRRDKDRGRCERGLGGRGRERRQRPQVRQGSWRALRYHRRVRRAPRWHMGGAHIGRQKPVRPGRRHPAWELWGPFVQACKDSTPHVYVLRHAVSCSPALQMLTGFGPQRWPEKPVDAWQTSGMRPAAARRPADDDDDDDGVTDLTGAAAGRGAKRKRGTARPCPSETSLWLAHRAQDGSPAGRADGLARTGKPTSLAVLGVMPGPMQRALRDLRDFEAVCLAVRD